jgi:hypothetical protein
MLSVMKRFSLCHNETLFSVSKWLALVLAPSFHGVTNALIGIAPVTQVRNSFKTNYGSLANIESLESEFAGRSAWKFQSNLGYFPRK